MMKREKYKKCNFTLCNFMDPKKKCWDNTAQEWDKNYVIVTQWEKKVQYQQDFELLSLSIWFLI